MERVGSKDCVFKSCLGQMTPPTSTSIPSSVNGVKILGQPLQRTERPYDVWNSKGGGWYAGADLRHLLLPDLENKITDASTSLSTHVGDGAPEAAE